MALARAQDKANSTENQSPKQIVEEGEGEEEGERGRGKGRRGRGR